MCQMTKCCESRTILFLQMITSIDKYSILYFLEAFYFEDMVFSLGFGHLFPSPPKKHLPGMAKVKEDVKVEVKVGPNLAQKLLGGSSP